MLGSAEIRLQGEAVEVPSPHTRTTSETVFTPGADVFTPRGPGAVIDVRATPAGKFVFGVENADGEVDYFTEKALRLAKG